MRPHSVLTRIAAALTAASLVSFSLTTTVTPASAASGAVTETITGDDVVVTHCEYSQFIGAAIEIKYYGRVSAIRKAWSYPETHDYYRSVEKPKVVTSFFSVTTYNKCGSGRTKKKVKDGFTAVTAWTGKKTTIDFDSGFAFSIPGGVSFGGSASMKTRERTVRERIDEDKAKRNHWTAVMNTTPLTWTNWKEIEHSTTPDGFGATIMKVYVHPILRWKGTSGTDYYDWGIKTAKLG